MRIAYIISAYIDALQLKRLVDSLRLSEQQGVSDFYIHVDAKVDICPFKKELEGIQGINWCKNRYWINWGGFNQVKSQYEMLRMIFEETKKEYDRVVCLSATDYPLWSNSKIIEAFSSRTEYIGGYNLARCNDQLQQDKVRDYHFFRDLQLPLRIKRTICFGARLIMHRLPLKKALYVFGDNGEKYEAYTGSDYWGLTYDCAKYVFETMRDDKKLMRYFRYSYIPSEGVINTIVFNSKYKEYCSIYCEDAEYPGLEALTPLHYTYYKGAIKIYTIDDWDELMNTDRMFFRKARTGISDTLIERLEHEIR